MASPGEAYTREWVLYYTLSSSSRTDERMTPREWPALLPQAICLATRRAGLHRRPNLDAHDFPAYYFAAFRMGARFSSANVMPPLTKADRGAWKLSYIMQRGVDDSAWDARQGCADTHGVRRIGAKRAAQARYRDMLFSGTAQVGTPRGGNGPN